MDEKKNPTILTVIGYFAFLIGAAGCLYLFLMAASGEFQQVGDAGARAIAEHLGQLTSLDLSYNSKDRNITSGHGYYLRKSERAR